MSLKINPNTNSCWLLKETLNILKFKSQMKPSYIFYTLSILCFVAPFNLIESGNIKEVKDNRIFVRFPNESCLAVELEDSILIDLDKEEIEKTNN
ncbi:MAG: hypothetical protein SFU98_08270 [Leptospiraceae bacterium]|nr:hypothetical protein [Leptospiraceae bacterium]